MEEMMTILEVAQCTKLKVATLRKYVAREAIPFHRLGAAIRFKPSEVQAWIDRRSYGGATTLACSGSASDPGSGA